jgi:hypothetical protein
MPIDYAETRNPDDPWERRIDLRARAKAESRFGSCGFRDGKPEPIVEQNGPSIPLMRIAD